MSDYISQTKIRLTAGLLISALIGTTALAADVSEPNVFNAETTHPDLAAVITSFQDVCMPFVLHQTEMVREHDKRHMAKLMKSRGYAFQTSVQETKNVLIEPKREHWKPARYDQERLKGIFDHNEKQNGKPETTRGQFTVFDGVSNQVFKPLEPQPGEIRGSQIPAKYRRVLVETETYVDLNEPRLTAHLGWNYPSQNHPGKQCDITLQHTSFSDESWIENFIAKDKDWKPAQQTKPHRWLQCIRDDGTDFLFTVSKTQGNIQLSMTRSDFYEERLCHPRVYKLTRTLYEDTD